MKTIYQKPATDIVAIESFEMIAASVLPDIVENGQDLGGAPETGEISGNLSRGINLADEEW